MTARRSQVMHSERTVRLDAAPPAVWATLVEVGRYRSWWPWLRSFDGRTLAAGERWSCKVQPPVPYRVAFTIDLLTVVEATTVTAEVGGDVAGTARIDLTATADGTELQLVADLHAERPWLQRVERLARPVARFGHDRILDHALAQLAARVAGDPVPASGA